MDALSDVLRVMRLRGGIFVRGEFYEPWCVITERVEPKNCDSDFGATTHIIPYHFVLDGFVLVRLKNGREFRLAPGDSVLFPRNDWHLLGSDLDGKAVNSNEVIRRSDDGGLASIVLGCGERPTRMVCGFLAAEDVRGNPVLAALPSALHLDGRDGSARDWIRTTFYHAAEEIAAGRSGAEVMMGKISELLFIEAIQRYMESLSSNQTGWLAGLRDPFVSRAMALIHQRVAFPWTLDSLAREVGLSRSALATRFSSVLGVAPMQYLTNWRIHAAAHSLLHTGKSILQVAQEAGYDSEASFTRAFKRLMEVPPATWRRHRRPQKALEAQPSK